MAFTHISPRDRRHYPIAYSTASAPRTFGTFSRREESVLTSNSSATTESGVTRIFTLSDEGSFLSTDASTSRNFLTSNASGTLQSSSTADSNLSSNHAGREGAKTGSELRLQSYKYSASSRSTSSTKSALASTKELFESSSYNSRTSSGETFYTSNSYTTRGSDETGGTYEVAESFYEGITRSILSIFFSSRARAGTQISYTSSRSYESGYTRTNNNGGSTLSPYSTSDSGSDVSDNFYVEQIRTSAGTTTVSRYLYQTETVETDISYSILSTDLLHTVSSFYSIRTTKFKTTDEPLYTEVTLDSFLQEDETLTEFISSSYRISTIHGGGAFIVGGDVLGNEIVTGASASSVAYILRTQPTEFNSFSSEFYQGASGNVTLTIGEILSSFDAEWTTTSTTEDTRIVSSTVSTDLTADFGISTNEIKVLTSETFSSTYQETTTRSNGNYGTTTRVYTNSTTVPFYGYTSTITEFSTRYLDSSTEGFKSITYYSSYLTMTDFAQLVRFSSSTTNSTKTVKLTSFIKRNLPLSVGWTGGYRTSILYRSFITFDKGLQGGIQYESASDISDAVRSFYPVTVADQEMTTSTMTSPAVTMNLTVNSAKSNSYLSGLLPLGLDISLNRYMSFFPIDGYRSIFSTVGDSDMQSNYVLDYEEDGSSLIFLTSTGEYLTSAGATSGSETSKTVKTFSSVLNGLAKIQQGQVYDNGKKTIAKILSFASNRSIFGGQKFTDREGFIIYPSKSPPLSLYVFGPDSSSLLTQESTDIAFYNSERTSSLPANSVVFAPTTTFAYASDRIITYDRSQ